MTKNTSEHKTSIIRQILLSWFKLTLNEQMAILIILGLLILGLIARYVFLNTN